MMDQTKADCICRNAHHHILNFNNVEQHLDSLIEKLPELSCKCQEFSKASGDINTHRRLNSLTLTRNVQLLQVLELPQLMDTCIRNGSYEEALELAAYVRRLGKKHGSIPIIASIVEDEEGAWLAILHQLLAQLRTDLQLPRCLQFVGYQRRMELFSEAELRLKFLQVRDSWLQSLLAAIPTTDVNHHLSKTIELSRIHLFNIVTQYRAIFSDDEPILPSSKDQNVNESAIFYSWITEKKLVIHGRNLLIVTEHRRRAAMTAESRSSSEDWMSNQDQSCQELHLYHSNVNTLVNMHLHYPILTVLTLIRQPLESLNGVEKIPTLRELWAIECFIKDATAIEECRNLEKVYLYSNRISNIPNLKQLRQLRVLWLSGNNISLIKNLDNATVLQELYLANNHITQIGGSLRGCSSLETLNLSGNSLHWLKDLSELVWMASLKSLTLGDPMYGPSPVVRQCNYRSFMVFHMSSLCVLDQHPVEPQERLKVKEFYNNKLLYYRMLYHHCQANQNKILCRMERNDRQLMMKLRDQQCMYIYEQRHQQQPTCEDQTDKERMQNDIKVKLEHLAMKIAEWEDEKIEWRSRHKELTKVYQYQLETALQSAGNLSFIEHSDKSELVSVCQTLMDSFTCSYINKKAGIQGVRVLRVTQLMNKGLEVACHTTSWSPGTLMLLTRPHGVLKLASWPYSLIERGFVDEEELSVGVTNCLYFADSAWVKTIMSLKEANSKSKHRIRSSVPTRIQNEHRMAVLVQFSSQTLLARYECPEEADHNICNTVTPISSTTKPWKSSNLSNSKCSRKRNSKRTSKSGSAPSVTSIPKPRKSCDNYFVSSSKEVMPTFVMEYQYLFEEDPVDTFKKKMGWKSDIHSSSIHPLPLPSHPCLDKSSLPQFLDSEQVLESLTCLTLTACGIRRIGNLPQLPNIRTLNLSYNQMMTLNGLHAFPRLQALDLSYNAISTLTNTTVLSNLKDLNISWNKLRYLIPSFNVFTNIAPQLSQLNIDYNPIEDVKEHHVVPLARKLLPSLLAINGANVRVCAVTMGHTNRAQHKFPQGRVTNNQRLVSLKWTAELHCERKCLTESSHSQVETTDPQWASLKGLQLESFEVHASPSWQWVDLSDNLLDCLDFLANCPSLTELSLARNMIQSFGSSLHHLQHLVKLDLSSNYLTSIQLLQGGKFPSLKLLDVSCNHLTDLTGIDACLALSECYASNNSISSFEGLDSMKKCNLLKVIELTGNAIEILGDFRMFIIFYFQKIEHINGYWVQENDITEANQMYGGCLNKDYLLKNKNLELLHLTELTLTQCAIRKVDLNNNDLPQLRSLDLSKNCITGLWGMHSLSALETLNLSNNHMTQSQSILTNTTVWFPKLVTLYLNHNSLANLKSLHLGSMKNVTTLFLQDNELVSFDGLQEATKLQHLVLDDNQIQNVTSEECLLLGNLKELYLEANKIQNLFFIKLLKNLHCLFLGYNRICDPAQLRHLASLERLEELTLLGNPICRKHNHYHTVLQHLPLLSLLDGHTLEITNYN